MQRFDGKVALVTGAGTSGIGRAICARLAAEGAHRVAVNDLREADAAEAVADAPGGRRPPPRDRADVPTARGRRGDARGGRRALRSPRRPREQRGDSAGAPGEIDRINELSDAR